MDSDEREAREIKERVEKNTQEMTWQDFIHTKTVKTAHAANTTNKHEVVKWKDRGGRWYIRHPQQGFSFGEKSARESLVFVLGRIHLGKNVPLYHRKQIIAGNLEPA